MATENTALGSQISGAVRSIVGTGVVVSPGVGVPGVVGAGVEPGVVGVGVAPGVVGAGVEV